MTDHPYTGAPEGDLDQAGDRLRIREKLRRRGVKDRGPLSGQGGIKHPVNASGDLRPPDGAVGRRDRGPGV